MRDDPKRQVYDEFHRTAKVSAVRDQLYKRLGPNEARQVLATLFPNGSMTKIVEKRLAALKEEQGLIAEENELSVVDTLVEEIIEAYMKNPQFKSLGTLG